MANYIRITSCIALLGLSACSREPAAPQDASKVEAGSAVAQRAPAVAAPVAAASSARLQLLKAYLEAWNQHDVNRAGGFLADDVEYFDASFAGLQHGREAAVDKGISVFMRGVPDLRWDLRSAPIANSDGISFEWTLTGTNTGSWGGIPATNQKINLKGMTFIRFRGDKIAYQAVYYDSATLNRQLGL